jgi:AcrR family transcriptional regulator
VVAAIPVAESVIHAARREQLVAAAIDLLAESGHERASTVRIARRAGVSRGVLTYHFRDRAELIAAVVDTVYRLAQAEVAPRVTGATSARAALLAFIGSSVEFYGAHPRHMAALTAICAAAAPARSGARQHVREMDDVGELLRTGIRDGEFRDFDAGIMAAVIRAALDGAVALVMADGSAESVALLRAELVRTFDAATREDC